jgi:DNA-binding MarR family transcriptional regulator
LAAHVRSKQGDLTLQQLAVLLAFDSGAPPQSSHALADSLRLSEPVVARALKRLDALGLIRRLRRDVDCPELLVRLTPAGERVLANLENDWTSAAIENWTASEASAPCCCAVCCDCEGSTDTTI